jgi:galactonate dehydratase
MPDAIRLRRTRLAVQPALQSTPAAGPLDIADARAYLVREPVSRRAYTVVRLQTRSGLAGYGECAASAAPDFARGRQSVVGSPASAFEVIGRRLAATPALRAGVDMALLDIAGKAAKAPAYQFLGGPTRFKARAMAPLEGASDEELLAAMNRARAAGFRAFSVPLPPVLARNQGQAFALAVRKRLEALRSAGGPDANFVLDGAGSLTPGDAASVSSALERFHLLWFDEPCPSGSIGTLRKLAGENVTPIGLGRHVSEPGVFQDLLREDAIDVLRPPVGLTGISQLRRMAALAETYYVAVAPSHDGGPIETAAALHLAASIPNFFIQQIPFPASEEDRRMRLELAGVAVEAIEDGFFRLPTGAGLGIEVSEQALEKYGERVR